MAGLAPFRRGDDALRQRVIDAQAGTVEAFEALIREYDRAIYAYIYRLVRDGDDARDLTQEVWLRVSRHIGELREPDGFAPWLYRIARNCGLDFIRAQRSRIRPAARARRVESSEPADLPDLDDVGPEQHALSFDERRKVWEALGTLSEGDRNALFLREYKELSYNEIGAALGVTANAAEVRVFRARQRFRRRFVNVDAIVDACKVSSLELSALVDQEARTAELAVLQRHAEECPGCSERLQAMRTGRDLYRDLAVRTFPESLLLAQLAGSQVGAGLTGQMVTLIDRTAVAVPAWTFLAGVGAKAAAIALALLGSGLGSYELELVPSPDVRSPTVVAASPPESSSAATVEVNSHHFDTAEAASTGVGYVVAVVMMAAATVTITSPVAAPPVSAGAATVVQRTAAGIPHETARGHGQASSVADVPTLALAPPAEEVSDARGESEDAVTQNAVAEAAEQAPASTSTGSPAQGATASGQAPNDDGGTPPPSGGNGSGSGNGPAGNGNGSGNGPAGNGNGSGNGPAGNGNGNALAVRQGGMPPRHASDVPPAPQAAAGNSTDNGNGKAAAAGQGNTPPAQSAASSAAGRPDPTGTAGASGQNKADAPGDGPGAGQGTASMSGTPADAQPAKDDPPRGGGRD